MTRLRTNSYSSKITKRVLRGPGDRVWTFADFRNVPGSSVAATLSRLHRKGLLTRVRKGVFYRPKKTRFGPTKPSTEEVATAILRSRGIRYLPSGLPVYNRLGLTGQLSSVLTLDVDRPMRSLLTGTESPIRIRSVNSVDTSRPKERAVLDAIRDLHSIPDTTTSHTLDRLKEMFLRGEVSFDRATTLAMNEPPRVRAVLGIIGESVGASPDTLSRLKHSLNPTSTFRMGLSERTPLAKSWRVV